MENLPNFICRQVTRQFEGGRKPDHWRKLDSLTSKLVYSQGREQRTLELINDKQPKPSQVSRRPLSTEGEFGILLHNVFADGTAAVFTWKGYETIRGKRLAAFDYIVDKKHSRLSLGLVDLGSAIVPYNGSVYADPASGEVWRITDSAFDIPPEVRTKSVDRTVDYDSVTIGGKAYLLPVTASALLNTGSSTVLNQSEFRDYRKFDADSKIIFAASDPEPAN